MTFFEKLGELVSSFFDESHIKEEISLQLATTVLLLEIARSDMEISNAEVEIIRSVLHTHYNLSDTESHQLIELAKTHLEELISLRDFTKAINTAYTEEQKEHLIKAFWEVAYADGVLDIHEEHWINQLSDLLYVPRSMVLKHRHFSKPD